MSRIEQLKPKLKPCSVFSSGTQLILEATGTHEHLSISRSTASLIPLLDGTRSVQQIVDHLQRNQGHVEFKLLFSSIEKLAKAKFLVGDPQVQTSSDPAPRTREPHEKKSLFFLRVLLRWILVRKVSLSRPRPALFGLLAGATLVAAPLLFVLVAGTRDEWIPNSFLWVGGSYAAGIFYFFAAAAALITLRQLAGAGLLLLGTGRVYDLSLALSPTAITLNADDSSIYLAPRRWISAVFFLAVPALYLALAGAVALLTPILNPGGSLMVIAIFLAFLETSPHSRSSLTLLFQAFSSEKVLPHLVPYFRNRSLFSFMSWRDRPAHERSLLLYAACAIGWTGSFLFYLTFVAARNFPSLVLVMRTGTGFQGLTASAVLFSMAGYIAYLCFDLARTFLCNLFFPLTDFASVLARWFTTRKQVKPNDDTILKALKTTALFDGVSGSMLDRLVQTCSIRVYGSGAALLIQGKGNDRLFILLEGSVYVARRAASGARTRLADLEAGAVLGEVSALEGSPATADVVTSTKCRIMEIPGKTIKASSKELTVDLEKISAKVMLGNCVASSPLFKGMPSEVANFLSSRGQLRPTPKGTMITKQGDEDRTLFLLVKGKADVLKDGGKVGEIKQGGFFGEIALIAGIPRTASVVATETSLLLAIRPEDFWSVLAKNPSLSLFIETVAEARREGRAA